MDESIFLINNKCIRHAGQEGSGQAGGGWVGGWGGWSGQIETKTTKKERQRVNGKRTLHFDIYLIPKSWRGEEQTNRDYKERETDRVNGTKTRHFDIYSYQKDTTHLKNKIKKYVTE